MNQIIIHVDMDAFYASIEIRDHPELKGLPLIIGSLPSERGVVATCSYEARKFGVHSAMNIKEAYRLCPSGIYRRPNMEKYRAISSQIREIWKSYTPLVETVAFDEAYLDVTDQVNNFEDARKIGLEIKEKIKQKTGLSCSVGIAYCKTAAKTASEEDKPNGFFEIPTPKDFIDLIIDRDVRVLHTVGQATAKKLYSYGIKTVRDVRENSETVINLFGKQGQLIVNFAFGIDERKVIPYRPEDAKSISREVTFQQDVTNYDLLKDILVLLSLCVEKRAKQHGLSGNGITLKITYADMKGITRSKRIFASNSAALIWKEAVKLLDKVDKRPVRLIGVGIHDLSIDENRQVSVADILSNDTENRDKEISHLLMKLENRYGLNFTENLEKIYKADTLHKTVEYMRKHF